MLKFLRNGFWIVIVQKIRKKCLSHSGKMHFSVSGHVTLGVVWWRHELDHIGPLWVLSEFGPTEAYRCRVIANRFFPSNGIKRYFNGPLRDAYASFVSILMRIFPFFHNFAIFLLLRNCYYFRLSFFILYIPTIFLWLIDKRTSCRPIQSVTMLVIKKIGRPRNWTPLSPITSTKLVVYCFYMIIQKTRDFSVGLPAQ